MLFYKLRFLKCKSHKLSGTSENSTRLVEVFVMEKLQSKVNISQRAMFVTIALVLYSLSGVVVIAADAEACSSGGSANSSVINISVTIAASSTNTAGQTYMLVCSATVTETTSDPQLTFTWLHYGSDITPDTTYTRMVSTAMDPGDCSYSSTLTFSPLAVSHAGTYTCRVTAGGVTETQTNSDETVVVQSEC